MRVRHDPALRILRWLTVVSGTALIDLDLVWGQGASLAAWLLRIGFPILLVFHILMSRAELERVVLDDRVIARAPGRRDHFWQGVAVFFTADRVVARRRRVVDGRVGAVLAEAPRSAVALHQERHGAFVDSVRCDWPDGTVMRLRVRADARRRLASVIEAVAPFRRGPVARAVDWVRAGTPYEE